MEEIWQVLHESGCRDAEEVTRIFVWGRMWGHVETTQVLSTDQLLGNNCCECDLTVHLGKMLG